MNKLKTTTIAIFTVFLFQKTIAQKINFSVQAHQDDWQLFMSSKLIDNFEANEKVVFITFTGGEAGNGNKKCNGIIPYFQARENGSVYSIKFANDLTGKPQKTPKAINEKIVYINAENKKIKHNITKYIYRNSVSYFLRLPDGNGQGTGFKSANFKSLKKLKNNEILNISSIDNSTTYSSWNDLVATVKQIILNESENYAEAWVNAPSVNLDELSLNYNPKDHSDHQHTSFAVREAVKDLDWVGINGWVNYYSGKLKPNLTETQRQNAAGVFASYIWGFIEGGYETNFDSGHKSWLDMDYFAVDKMPKPRKKNSN